MHNIFVVIPQMVVALLSTLIFAGLSPETSSAPVPVPAPPSATDLMRRQASEGTSGNWDSIGLMFRCAAQASSSLSRLKLCAQDRRRICVDGDVHGVEAESGGARLEGEEAVKADTGLICVPTSHCIVCSLSLDRLRSLESSLASLSPLRLLLHSTAIGPSCFLLMVFLR